MAEAYRKLPGKSFGLFGSYRLWAGSDHLLAVESRRFIENYRRFYYADILAFQICERPGIGLPLEILLALAILLLIGATYQHYWLAILSVPAFIVWFWDKIRGPRSHCAIRTATGTWRLPSLSRMKAAQKCRVELQSIVGERQGAVDVDAMMAAGRLPHLAPSTPSPPESGIVFLWPLFLMTLVASSLAWYDATHPVSSTFATAEWVLAFTLVILAVLGLSLYRNPSSGGPRLAAVSILGLTCIQMLTGFFALVFAQARDVSIRQPANGTTELFEKILSELKTADNGIQVVVTLAAVAGIFTLLIHRKNPL